MEDLTRHWPMTETLLNSKRLLFSSSYKVRQGTYHRIGPTTPLLLCKLLANSSQLRKREILKSSISQIGHRPEILRSLPIFITRCRTELQIRTNLQLLPQRTDRAYFCKTRSIFQGNSSTALNRRRIDHLGMSPWRRKGSPSQSLPKILKFKLRPTNFKWTKISTHQGQKLNRISGSNHL